MALLAAHCVACAAAAYAPGGASPRRPALPLHARATDHIHLRMDIEGSEYPVYTRLITTGLHCWFDVVEFEFHSLYSEENRKHFALDYALPHLQRACGSKVAVEQYYWDDQDVRRTLGEESAAKYRTAHQLNSIGREMGRLEGR